MLYGDSKNAIKLLETSVDELITIIHEYNSPISQI